MTGPLFTYRNADRSAYTWVDVENWVSTWELKVAEAARRCSHLLLDLDRPHEAGEVAQHALSIIPTDTILTETLMRSHAANGDRLAVQRVYQEHLSALEQLDLDQPDESTGELYVRLVSAGSG